MSGRGISSNSRVNNPQPMPLNLWMRRGVRDETRGQVSTFDIPFSGLLFEATGWSEGQVEIEAEYMGRYKSPHKENNPSVEC